MTNPLAGPVTALDVRPLLATGEEPFDAIMAAGIACFGVYCFFWARMARY